MLFITWLEIPVYGFIALLLLCIKVEMRNKNHVSFSYILPNSMEGCIGHWLWTLTIRVPHGYIVLV
jgi:hypothetical protein